MVKAGLALAACVAAWAAIGGARAEPEKIRIGWIVTPAELTPYMFAKDGIARHNGVSYTLEPIRFQGSPLEVTAIQSGDLDIAPFGSSSFAIAVENAGLGDLRIIADEVQDGVPGWAGPELRVLKDGPIKTIDDLKGKVLATNGFGGATDIAIKMMMLKHKLVQNRDYTEIEAAHANMNALLLEQKADLVTSVHPFQDDPNFAAKSRVLFRPSDALGRFELSFWTAREGYISSHRAVLTDLLEDYVRAFHWYLDPAHRAEAIQIVASFTKRPPASFENWLFQKQDEYHDPDAVPDIDAVTRNVHAQHEVGLVKADLDARHYADLSLLKAAIARVK
ncbi:MAG TPA: ABC transporter substrate-binding protein [Stellaceae bacterium]|nr:ABC transporter substrate-binding protein [Stellaceae bacterium]